METLYEIAARLAAYENVQRKVGHCTHAVATIDGRWAWAMEEWDTPGVIITAAMRLSCLTAKAVRVVSRSPEAVEQIREMLGDQREGVSESGRKWQIEI